MAIHVSKINAGMIFNGNHNEWFKLMDFRKFNNLTNSNYKFHTEKELEWNLGEGVNCCTYKNLKLN